MSEIPDMFAQPVVKAKASRPSSTKRIAAIVERMSRHFSELDNLELEDKVQAINLLRARLSEYSPFRSEPVDCVQWVRAETVHANDYNPNSVAPPEMELLRLSIMADGFTQPVVSCPNEDKFEVVDGFHRNRVGKECEDVAQRVKGYLPIVQIRAEQADKPDRMASTIRHNRARGKHRVDAMSDIVLELKRRNWSNEKIGKQLGMDPDEVLRLSQISGLADAFADRDFSEAWEANPAALDDGSVPDENIGDEMDGAV